MHPDPIVGIDLGTTNSLVAYCDERGPRVIPDELGRPLCPSVIKLTQNTAPASGDGAAPPFVATVGYEAREARRHATRGTFSSIKRFMGRGVGDNPGDLSYLSYEVVEGSNHAAMARVRAEPGQPADAFSGRLFAMEELSAHILAKLREQASRALGVPVRKAVITVPAYFDDAQRQATRAAGRLAGLEVLRLVNEPTAAALAYGLGLRRASARNTGDSVVAVYDLGGGTFDISILKLTSMPTGATGGVGGEAEVAETSFFQVLATAGDTRLGGDDVDRMLAASVAAIAHPGVADPIGALPDTERQALIAACERAKIALSERTEASVDIELAGRRVVHTITRDQLDAIIAPWVERSIECCRRAMADASKKLAGVPIEVVVLVGGSSRIPLVRARVREFFGVEPYAALDPDQVVALGASVQASILAGATKGSLLLDVIPLSLGIETVGGAAAKLVMRNTTVPARAVEMFSTSVDGQTSIKLNIVQGEREMAADCRSLGVFHLRGLPPMPAGIPQVAVEFLVDANGVLNVAATERRSGKRAQVQVIPNHGLTSEDVERIEREAFAHAREDMTQHQVVDLIANSELDLKWIGDRLARHGSLLEADQRAALEGAIATLRDFTTRARADWRSVNPTEFHRAKEALERASVRLQEISITQSLKSEKA